MTDQYPPARSLKDDPPPINTDYLAYNGKRWSLWRGQPVVDVIKFGCTHWLPMPPDPPKPKQAWEDQWNRFRGEEQPGYLPPPEKDCFKAGWNAALESVSRLSNMNALDSSQLYPIWKDLQDLRAL